VRRRALWAGLLAACERVERAAAASAERDPGVLDWFGVSVKAAEIPAHVARMRVLARKVRAAPPARAALACMNPAGPLPARATEPPPAPQRSTWLTAGQPRLSVGSPCRSGACSRRSDAPRQSLESPVSRWESPVTC